ncbi:hypothetical protein AYO40_06575 [Planctomycetaceae bacterium SCGC AG-212-D15]|nr:hypothetical protein AYO40_06575 [Planctomycetaceae bacterium SCGC AG-212-D15]
MVLGDAASALATKGLSSLEGLSQSEILAVLKGGFGANRVFKDGVTNNVLYLSFRGTNRDDCQVILDAIMQKYDTYLKSKYERLNDKTVREVLNIIKELKKGMDETKQKEDAWLAKNPPPTEVSETLLTNLRTRRSNETILRDSLQRQVKDLDHAIKIGQGAEMFNDMRRVSAHPQTGNTKLDEKLWELYMQMALLQADYGEGHPQIQSVKRQIEAVRALYYGAKAKEVEMPKPGPDDPARWHLQSLKRELVAAQANLDEIEKQCNAAEYKARAREEWIKQEARFKESALSARQSYEEVGKRLNELQLSKNFGGVTADVIEPATPALKVAPVPAKIFIVAMMLGLLLGAGLAFVAEAMDQNFHTLEEIRERLGLAVVGHIPIVEPVGHVPGTPATAMESILCTYYQPKSVQAEAFRGIRTALYFSLRSGDYKVIQITSPEARDGKTTLSANLAVSIAQSGKKVVLLDADFRKPRMHEIFGVSADVGVASVIAGTAKLKDAVKPTAVEGLSILPCGPRPANPAELLTSPAFEQLLADLRKEYDFVLVDTPPLLAVSDPSAVAPRVDGVLLVVRFSKNARPSARRAKEILESMRADVVGVVVNGYGRNGSGYGYDAYRYGYDQAYGYGSNESGYYHEHEGSSRKPANGNGHGGGIVARLFRWLR